MTREIAEPEKKDEQTDMLKKQVAELQEQLAELQKKDQSATLTERVAELEARLTEAKSPAATAPAPDIALPRATTGATGQRPTEFIPPRDGTCWGCGDPGHRLWACPKLSNAEKKKLDRRRIRPNGEHSHPVCITVKYRGRPIPALVDTGCDMTIAGSALAKKHRWKIRPAELQSVKTANDEHMLTEGVATVTLTVGRRNVRHKIHVMPDLNELIIGSVWMAKQGKLTWDYTNHQVRFGDGNKWIALHREIDIGCRRVIVETSTVLLLSQETDVPVRITRESRRSAPYEGITEALKVPNLRHVCSERSVLPAQFTKLRVRVVNADTREPVLRKGT